MIRFLLLSCLILPLAGCSPPHKPVRAVPSFPDVFLDGTHLPEAWWQVFADPVLDGYMARLVSGNPDLAARLSAYRRMREVARMAGAGKKPEMHLGLSASRERSPFPETLHTADRYGISVAASWEIDLWGRISSLEAARRLDAEMAKSEAAALLQSLSAEVATLHFRIRALTKELRNFETEIRDRKLVLSVSRKRYVEGTLSSDGLYQAEETLLMALSMKREVADRIRTETHALAILLGSPPVLERPPDASPVAPYPPFKSPPPRFAVSTPDLLLRPDIRSALMAIARADLEVAAALSDRYPRFTLTGSTGYRSGNAGLFDPERFVWQVLGDVMMPVIDGGRRNAEVRRQREVVKERLETFRSKLLVALREVMDAVVRDRGTDLRLSVARKRAEVLDARAKKALYEYLQGRRSLLGYLGIRERQFAARRDVIQLSGRVLENRIAVVRAIGGSPGWALRVVAVRLAQEEGGDP